MAAAEAKKHSIDETKTKEDVIISIHPQHVQNIVNRTKNHKFRKYLLPSTVRRFWIYETKSASAVKYVATISQGKCPGEICDPSGLNNDMFDAGELQGQASYGYEILKLEELPQAYTLSDLKDMGWVKGPPQKYCFAPKAMCETLDESTRTLLFQIVKQQEQNHVQLGELD